MEILVKWRPCLLNVLKVSQEQAVEAYKMAAAIYRQQKVLSHFPVCCSIDWLLMIKDCLIESGPPCNEQEAGWTPEPV
jgi:hypothetical protein